MKHLIAFLCAATALPELWLRRRVRPLPPPPEAIAWQEGRSWYHNMKNLAAETVRADASYFAKLGSFLVLVLLLATTILTIMKTNA